ncbi:MAG: indoleacetamide hydrolase [Steroidobacteraceae bacterium]
MSIELPGLSASQALRLLDGGDLTAWAYVQSLLERTRRCAELNSLIAVNASGALAAARRIDALRKKGTRLPPLAGLPLVVKDNIDFAGMPTTGGTPALRDFRPAATAPALQRLLDAGAIVLGKANMHELALGVTSTNFAPFTGAVRNPYDIARVAGGSSGGTAAAIAAGIAPAGLGTDTGGSVRIPASFCGLAGLRPSVGNGGAQRRYEGRGVLPISHTRDVIGPMARMMEDVALLDSVMSGEPLIEPVAVAGARFGMARLFWEDADGAVAAVMERALVRLQSAGAVLVDVDLSGLGGLTAETAFVIAAHEAREDIASYLSGAPGNRVTLADVVREIASPDVRAIMDDVMRGDLAREYEFAITQGRPRMQGIYARCFAEHALDALVFPTVTVPPPVIDPVRGSVPGFFAAAIRNTDAGSTAGLPGITVPAGATPGGLPVGIALDGPVGSDRRLMGLGMSAEAILCAA